MIQNPKASVEPRQLNASGVIFLSSSNTLSGLYYEGFIVGDKLGTEYSEMYRIKSKWEQDANTLNP